MDESQVQLIIQNVVANALKAQSAILDKKFKELEDKLALAYGVSNVNGKPRTAQSLENKNPIYDCVSKDILIKLILPCPPLSTFPSNCLMQLTQGLNQTTGSEGNNNILLRDKSRLHRCGNCTNYNSSRPIQICPINNKRFARESQRVFFSALNQNIISLHSILLSINYLRFKNGNCHAFWKIYPPPKIIKYL